ncbi:SNARE Ykt6 [Schizosaccharomyces pombe]|uniref:Synaptobrevin homolog ykt6 n=1 Tax=Schizosaccharomyces pombe (strain 972 / ATCC 24843) TaxID=284812 RepID=YKT6_SCHPO|nr:putative SNARE protein Ykt6 [Schizosaccharomyces pombe]O60073.1 RecName: Full=Synaptobrevin homolog ykt6; Flags: Precursor [Schizosaccharomyces pombe 972h-]CAA18664.1 SNARE Ykt6 (predicted) [Schizosaccharomyces pombe]|eukprot:NP_596561.1 putative SNARE protein Ykt6 [Schizosaccharomyces pombe]
MKLYSVSILRFDPKPVQLLCTASDLSSFSFFQRSSIGEFMNFFTKTVAERTNPGQRQDVEQSNYVFHVYNRSDGLCGVIASDKEYPLRVAYTLLNKILDEFLTKNPRTKWESGAVTLSFPELDTYLSKYQDPKQADTIMRVQQELDETKDVLHKTIESVLARGEKLDDLIQRSDNLSTQSRMFYKSAKKQNSCCIIA